MRFVHLSGGIIAVKEIKADLARNEYRLLRALRRLGAGTLEATFDAAFERQPVGYARRGDLVMVDGIAGVCLGGAALFVGDVDGVPGWVRHDRAAWSAAWKIG